MTKLTDGKRTVEITMQNWDTENHCYDCDFFSDFFEVGGLKMDDDGAYLVPDVEYCIEAAHDWENFAGDFVDDYNDPRFERTVFVD